MFHGFNTPFTQCSMDVNSIQNILRPSGWARRLITACIAILHMGVLYANIATIQRVGSTKWRPAGTTTTLPTTNQCRRPSTTTTLYETLLPPDEPRGPRVETSRPHIEPTDGSQLRRARCHHGPCFGTA